MKAEEFIESVKEHHWDRSIETYVRTSYALKALKMSREEVRQEILKNTIECEVVGIKKSILADSSGSISYGFIEIEGNYKQGDKVRIYVFKEE